ncbi:MAG TPA: histidine kinase dimerization/phosphoacceptor domain -containing protein [Geminicoccaceae bacterium]|nr:histidine kinase dimerization/phosphoacceptor domain -containing protein [Geminicoccus sp.]HMU48545.1 histidine kinase dimerization/phosphoacceptor domain -containing protein [Geminicoccaceae bacterium]
MVLGIVLLPAVACSIWLGYLAYREHSSRLSATLQSSAAVISTYEEQLLAGAESTLGRLLAEPAVASMREPACSEYLANELRRFGGFITLARIDDDGVARCASIPDVVGVGYADRLWFGAIRRGDRPFVISEVVTSRVLRRPTVVLALRSPGVAGAITATMDVRSFTPSGALTTVLELNSSLVLVDNEAMPLIDPRDGEVDQSLTIPPRGALLAALVGPKATFEAVGLDGVRRLYAIAPVGAGSLNVVLGTPVGGTWDWLESRAPMILAPILLLLLALSAIWVATNYLVSRHVQALSLAARRWSHGHGHDWPDLRGAPAELDELGSTFSEMAERIARREDELQASLAQKEVLLKEIHHRVKNNLQIVSSLINLRARASRNPEVKIALEAVQMRIKALALVHRNLYEREEPTSIDLEPFLIELCQLFGEAVGDNDKVEILADVEPGRASADRATPIALLIAESVNNALRYGFPDGRQGTILVRLERADGMARLSISDDGVGRGPASADGVGITLCRMLAKQIGGELRLGGPPGTTVTVTFAEQRTVRTANTGLPKGNPGPTSDIGVAEGT